MPPGRKPKLPTERRRKNKTSDPPSKPAQAAKAPLEDEGWDARTTAWYQSLIDSPSALYFQASDWQHAMWICDLKRRLLSDDELGTALVTAIDRAASRLLVTVGDRLHAHLDIEKEALGLTPAPAEDSPGLIALDKARERMKKEKIVK